MSNWPWPAAATRAVPRSPPLWFGLAPASSRSFTSLIRPSDDATTRAVCPSGDMAFTLAPASSRSWTQTPRNAADTSGASRSPPQLFGSAPPASKALTTTTVCLSCCL